MPLKRKVIKEKETENIQLVRQFTSTTMLPGLGF